ncbi:MAG TPA: HlyD family efflux transporter periplasmic adaptor subunit [Steroidobacteraceae bacterium]|nr:HlyD family efflux transporter periplasmic adaptor subunit [Steroidobacteraceae bacterium]HRX90661.1 HlyD family efflux transporter periplasmic adaptor subunit [Steroidobacteraceae bacterium]
MKIEFSRTARATPETIGGLKVPYAPAKRESPRWRWYLIIAAVASPALLLALGLLGGFITRSAEGSVMLDQLEVRAIASGRVDAVAIEVGMDIEADASLVTTRSSSEPRLALAVATGSQSATATLREELALRDRMLRLARERRDSLARLVSDGAATRAELREAEYALDNAAAAELQVRRSITELTRPAAGTAARARNTALDATINRAPFAGKVLDVFVSQGEIVRAGDPLALIGRSTSPKVVAYVPPDFATRIESGTPATIFFADGTQALASVTEPARITRRMPADLVDSFGMRPMMVVLKLATDSPWPKTQAIHGMPVRIRFHYQWERSGLGGVLSNALDSLVGDP